MNAAVDIAATRARPRTARTVQRARDAFCAALSRGLSVSAAVAAANVPRSTAYGWRDEDKEFRERWEVALEVGSDALEDEARRRAVEGVSRPVVSGGKVVVGADDKPLAITEYSDRLLEFLLKARRPEKYRERMAQEITGPRGAPLISAYDLTKLPDADLEQLERILTAAAPPTERTAP